MVPPAAVNRKMSTPEQEIAALETEIGGYSEELKEATDNKEKSELRQLITATRNQIIAKENRLTAMMRASGNCKYIHFV